MSIKSLASELEVLKERADAEGWGGKFSEEMFNAMLKWAKEPRKHSSLGLLFAHLISLSKKWTNPAIGMPES